MPKTICKPKSAQEAIEVGKALIKGRWSCCGMKELDDIWKDDLFVMKELVKFRPDVLEYASDELRANKELAMIAIETSPKAFKFVLGNLNDDRDLVKSAVLASVKGENLAYASERLKSDKNFIMEIIQVKPMSLEHVSKDLADDEEVVKLAISKNPNAIKYASMRFKDDKELILSLINKRAFYEENGLRHPSTRNLFLIAHASDRLRSDPDIIIPALKRDVFTYRCVSDSVKEMRKLALYVVKKEGSLLADVLEKYRNDKEIVLAAVKNYSCALEFASEELKNDKEVVLAAVRKDGRSIVYASKSLRENVEFVLEAYKSYGAPFIVNPLAQNVFQRLDRGVVSSGSVDRIAKVEIKENLEKVLLKLIHEIEDDFDREIEEIRKSSFHPSYIDLRIQELLERKAEKIRNLKESFKDKENYEMQQGMITRVYEKLSKESAFSKLKKFYNGTIKIDEMIELEKWLLSQAQYEDYRRKDDLDFDNTDICSVDAL